VAPADQCLGTDHAAIHQPDLGLIEQLEFPSLHGEREFGLERQARLELPPDCAFEDHMAAAPCCLGTAESEMTVAQKVIRGSAMLRKDGGPDRNPEAVLARSRGQGRVERLRHSLGKLRDRALKVGAADGDRKLVATQARNQTRTFGLRSQPHRDSAQHKIAAGVSQHIVDVLEAVETNHQQRDLARQLLGRGNHSGQAGVERVAIGEPGE
jgi:hypothetical protein